MAAPHVCERTGDALAGEDSRVEVFEALHLRLVRVWQDVVQRVVREVGAGYLWGRETLRKEAPQPRRFLDCAV